MTFTIERVAKGNRREVPGNIPPMLWLDKVEEYASGRAQEIDFYAPGMEYLRPDELKRVKAKALIWWEILDEWPKDISVWWEMRNARRRGDAPHTDETTTSHVDAEGVLHCGNCDARWSHPFPSRCKLCDRILEDAPDGIDD